MTAFLLTLLPLLLPVYGFAGDRQYNEQQVKAAFLVNFVHYVSWPAEVFSAEDSPIVICLFGQNDFDKTLDENVADKKFERRPLLIRRLDTAKAGIGCHLGFFSSKSAIKLDDLHDSVRFQLFSVGDGERFLQQGGVLQLFLQNGFVRFNINLDAAKKASLKISSNLLKLANHVKQRP